MFCFSFAFPSLALTSPHVRLKTMSSSWNTWTGTRCTMRIRLSRLSKPKGPDVLEMEGKLLKANSRSKRYEVFFSQASQLQVGHVELFFAWETQGKFCNDKPFLGFNWTEEKTPAWFTTLGPSPPYVMQSRDCFGALFENATHTTKWTNYNDHKFSTLIIASKRYFFFFLREIAPLSHSRICLKAEMIKHILRH